MDRFQEMRVFAAVVDSGSFVRAADELSMSKAAVSRYVSELEARLGARLLHRTTRKLSLTGEGELFLARSRDILASLEEAEAELTTRSGHASGLLKVNVPLSFGIRHLAPLWPRFMAQHPGVTVHASLGDRVVDLLEEGFDLAIRIARLPDSTLVSRRLASTRLVLCAAPAYIAGRGAPAHPSELPGHDVIGYTLLAGGDTWDFQGPDGAIQVTLAPRLRSNNGDTCVEAALRAAGIVLQPTFLIADHLRAGTLVELLPGYSSIELDIYAVYPTKKFVPHKVRALVEFLAAEFVRPGWQGA
ncbi:LysR family transcriptional regulator [Caenimonas sedimenti]|uniref:LysR family transcriptional regulator n=1 Tax=Caenimonas sedimenti TaxID=2596921 RepID=A0A562ZH28_9BURK|nr:LysR family transcriptional regulator [Caenimonas sedimenti]TWO67021.1 LysR family transcriptional regulator [Caenimonas sedimenti]